jgi:hypothetical protein
MSYLENRFSHVKTGDTLYKGAGLRDFFLTEIWGSQRRPAARL